MKSNIVITVVVSAFFLISPFLIAQGAPFILINAPTDGTTDAAPIINSTITHSIAATPPVNHFYLPCGIIRIQSAINMTNEQAGITLEGCGQPLSFQLLNIGATSEVNGGPSFTNETAILCDTGNVCIDTAGSSSYKIKNLKLVLNPGNFPTPSTVGVLTGRVNSGSGGGSANPFCWAQFNEIDSVSIIAGHDTTGANGGYGTVGLANIGAEHFLLTHSHLVADFPLILDSANSLYGFTSPNQGHMEDGCPASMTIFTGIADSLATAGYGAVMQANNTADVVFQNLHSLGGPVFRIGGTTSNWHVQGQFESAPISSGLMILFGNIDHLQLQAAVSAWTGSGGPGFIVSGTTGPTISNSSLQVSVQNGASAPLLQDAPFTISGGELDFSTTSVHARYNNVRVIGGAIIKSPGVPVSFGLGCGCLQLN
jgi:hypothetical protein